MHATIPLVGARPLLLCLVLSGAAAAAGHRDRAQIAESTGHTAQAAKEYEQAYAEEGDPDILYRLGLVRRRELSELSPAFAAMPPETRRRVHEPWLLTLTKAQSRSSLPSLRL